MIGGVSRHVHLERYLDYLHKLDSSCGISPDSTLVGMKLVSAKSVSGERVKREGRDRGTA